MTEQITVHPPRRGLPAGLTLSSLTILMAGLVAGAVAWGQASAPVAWGILLGVAVSAGGTLTWLVVLRLTFHRGGNVFLGAMLGGVLLRMLVYGGILVAAAVTGRLHLGALMVALFGSHLAYQAVEILLIHRSQRRLSAAEGRSVPLIAAVTILALLLLPVASLAAGVQKQEPAHGETVHGENTGHAEGEHGEGFDILHHVVDGKEVETPFGVVHLPERWMVAGIDMSPTKHVVWMWISALLVMAFVLLSARKVGMVSTGTGNFLESIVVFIRDEIAGKNIGHHPQKFTPYLCTLFFFIMFCNLAGLVPMGATATGNLNMTAGLALLSLIMIQGAGIKQNGLVKHIQALCPIPQGVPGWLLPLYVPIIIAVEVVGIFAKPIALALRLFANMTAGHVVILSLIGLIFILQTHLVAPVSVAFALFIYCLEVFVGLVQAYIFTMLTALFIGMSQHPAH